MNNWPDITRATNAQILAWAEAQPWARAMAACQQDAQWHAEGDVWTHTRMVCAELERLADWPSLDRAAQLKLLFTALFHDAGKPTTTVPDPDTGRTRSPKHALVVDATDNQGTVIQTAREQCREHLRAGRDFAFNATNLTRQMRGRWIELFADYGARIVIVYVEPPVATILAQNKRRPDPVPASVILRLVEKLEPPTVTECHSLTFV